MTTKQQKQTSCGFDDQKFPDELVVLAGGSETGRKSGGQIDDSGHEATVMDVVVNVPGTPVALMLGAYEPTIWKVSRTPETRIVAIVLNGYYTQMLTGVAPDIPIINSTYSNQGPCDLFFLSGDGMDKLESLTFQLFQRPLQEKFFAKEGKLVIGSAVISTTKLVDDHSVAIESLFTAGAPPAGATGIRQAIEQGILRQATLGDSRAWDLAYRHHQKLEFGVDAPLLPMTDGEDSEPLLNAYVVLKPFKLPAGLSDTSVAGFFVPRGVPRPTGSPGIVVINDFNQLRQ